MKTHRRQVAVVPLAIYVALASCWGPAEGQNHEVVRQASTSADPLRPDKSCFNEDFSILETFTPQLSDVKKPERVDLGPAPIARDVYALGAKMGSVEAAQQLIELARVYQRVCMNDMEPWDILDDGVMSLYLRGHPDDGKFLSRIYTGAMGRKAGSLSENMGDVDIFVIAPTLTDWAYVDLASDLERLLGRAAHAYVLMEELALPKFRERVDALPERQSIAFERVGGDNGRWWLDGFVTPLTFQSNRVTSPVKLGSVFVNEQWSVLIHLTRTRQADCPEGGQ